MVGSIGIIKNININLVYCTHVQYIKMDMQQTILIGTSGYSYEDWVGPVYPPGTPGKDFLSHYANVFQFCELNNTQFRQPEARLIERLAHATPDRFRFAIRAHKSLTHEIAASFKQDAIRFKEGIAPLNEYSKLAAVIAQFPSSFGYSPENRKHLQALCDEFAGMPFVVEFHNMEWFRESVYEGLRKRSVAIANVDSSVPDFHSPSTPLITSHITFARFCGRSDKNSYSAIELEEWLPRIQAMAKQSQTILIVFSNCGKGQAFKNAGKLKKMIEI